MTARTRTPKRITKKERKALEGKKPAPAAKPQGGEQHIHCVACGVHLNSQQFSGTPATARWVSCQHGSRFASCTACVLETERRLEEHDRTGRPVVTAKAWH